jgi:tetratricopeptide (TPR) repeat protein
MTCMREGTGNLNSYDYSSRISVIIFLLAALSIAASFVPGWHIWGLDSPRAFPIWIRFAILALLLALVIPGINAAAGKTLSNRLKSSKIINPTIVYFGLGLLLTVLFVLFRSNDHFLGDGYTILANVKGGQYFQPTEPLDYFTHQVLFKLLGGNEKAVYLSYSLTSYASGVVFLLGLYLFIKNKTHLILSLGVVSCFAAVQFFFGYVESYIIAFTLMFLYSLSAIRDMNEERLSITSIVLLVLAIAFHIASAVLIPSAVFLATGKYSQKRKYFIFTVAFLAAFLAGAAYLILSSKLALGDITVPFWKTADNPYSLFSIRHFTDLANLMLLSYPMLLVIFLVGDLRKKFLQPLYLSLIAPGLLFTILIDPKLGALRDWDLLSIAAAPLLAFAIAAMFERKFESPRAYSIFIILGLFGILHTGGWISQNASMEKSYPIVKAEVSRDPHYSRLYKQGWGNKSWATLAAKYESDAPEVTRAALERYYGDPDDTLNTCELTKVLLAIGDTNQCLEIIRKNWPRYSDNIIAVSSLSLVMAQAGRFDEAEQICHAYLAKKGDDPNIYYGLGNLKQYRGQRDSSFYYLDKAFSVKPDASAEKQFTLYLDCFTGRYDKLAQSGFERILPKLTGSARAGALSILNILNKGDKAQIDSLRDVVIKAIQQNNNK